MSLGQLVTHCSTLEADVQVFSFKLLWTREAIKWSSTAQCSKSLWKSICIRSIQKFCQFWQIGETLKMRKRGGCINYLCNLCNSHNVFAPVHHIFNDMFQTRWFLEYEIFCPVRNTPDRIVVGRIKWAHKLPLVRFWMFFKAFPFKVGLAMTWLNTKPSFEMSIGQRRAIVS